MTNQDVRSRNVYGSDLRSSSTNILISNNTSFEDVGTLRNIYLNVKSNSRLRVVVLYLITNILITLFLRLMTSWTGSMALHAFLFLSVFDICSLLSSFVYFMGDSENLSEYSFGHARREVLAVFCTTMLAMLGSLFILKESVERFLFPVVVSSDYMLMATSIALTFHLFVTYGVSNRALNHVIATAPSSWLQEHVSDVSRAICAVIPGMDKILLPRINSVTLIGIACAFSLFLTSLVVSISGYHTIDTLAAVAMAFMILGTMFPLSLYTGKILVQTTPPHVVGQLDKCLREISTLDGVLESQDEHFWVISLNDLCGSVRVRVRRDANEQLVLAHVLYKLSDVATSLTVHIAKDDWTQLSAATKFMYHSSTVNATGHGHSHSHDNDHSHGNGHSHSHGHTHSHSSPHAHGDSYGLGHDHFHHNSNNESNVLNNSYLSHSVSYKNSNFISDCRESSNMDLI